MESIKELNVYPEKGHSIMFVFRRKPGMSLEEFRYHYEFTHGALATKLPSGAYFLSAASYSKTGEGRWSLRPRRSTL
ncbi:EthD domain-containing protein [Paenibacillus sp. FSL R7-0340]|uniref:EthD domain-containing protein n=1 Tax=Paenibacillus sp. FSL R7-0340 TaxID=2921684 RepID=UPI0030F91575